eukprot:gene23422-biopygen23831
MWCRRRHQGLATGLLQRTIYPSGHQPSVALDTWPGSTFNGSWWVGGPHPSHVAGKCTNSTADNRKRNETTPNA